MPQAPPPRPPAPLATHSGPVANWAERRISRKGLKPRHAAIAIVAFWLLAVLIFGVIERLADPRTFPSVWLAFWWAIQTVTTVGYGDVVPDQTTGKVMAAFLMLGGLSTLSILTATITSAFITYRQQQIREAGQDPLANQLEEISARLKAMETELQHLRSAQNTSDQP
jgi:voltage-gated potassium channel